MALSSPLEWKTITKQDLMSICELPEATAEQILQRRGDKDHWDENDWEWLVSVTDFTQEEWNDVVVDGNRTLQGDKGNKEPGLLLLGHSAPQPPTTTNVDAIQKMIDQLIADREVHDFRMAELDVKSKQSDERIQVILSQMKNLQVAQDDTKRKTTEDIGKLHHAIRNSGDKLKSAMDDKFDALSRRLDKMTTSEEASTVQFKKCR